MTLDEIHHNIFVNTIYRLTDIQKLLHATCRDGYSLANQCNILYLAILYAVKKKERETQTTCGEDYIT
jgi:hypothetical protein